MTLDDPQSPGINGNGTADSPISGELDPATEHELAAVLDAYLAEVEAGNPVDPEDWIRRHPAIASRLRACLRGLHLVEAAAEALSVASAPAGEVGKVLIRRDPATALLPTGSPPLDLEGHREDSEPLELGGFRVVREIARGGMGVVYEAIEIALGRRVALKVLPFAAAIDPRQIARFRVEAQAASQLNHSHIVPVYSVGCHGGVHFYAMQLVEGPTLADLIIGWRDQNGAAGPTPAPSPGGATAWSFASPSGTASRDRSFFGEVARLGRQAAEALEHAHQQGVLHRDVKPSNLMVDARGQLWVADFGLARFQGEATLTAPGDLLGTLRYMSPEQAASERALVDARSDVYSLGATLYELITLRPVFAGNNRHELLRRIAQEEPRRPRSVRPEVPRDLETIVLKAMAKDPSARYATAQDLAEDLGRFLDDRPILARPPALLEKVARWARRHAAALAIAVPLLAAIAIALGVAFGLVLSKHDQLMGKQRELIAKQREVEGAHGEARRQRDEARRAVDEMYTQFAAMLGRQPDLQLIQRDFLLKALAYYQTYATEADPDPSVRGRAGIAAFRVGEIQRTLGHAADAERAYRRAIEVLESIPRDPVDRNRLEVLG
ncbi:MAG: serine/threonine-protein kinase, partial [Isosphaeraceae bacterium]